MIVISPPFFSPDAPLLGSTVLYDKLTSDKVHAQYIDLNLIFYQKLISDTEILKILNEGIAFLRDENRNSKRRKRLLLATYIIKEYFEEFRQISCKVFQHKSTPADDRKFYKYINALLLVLSEKYYPTRLSFYHYSTGISNIWQIETAYKYLDDVEHNIIYYIIGDLVKKVQEMSHNSSARIIFLSATFQSQLLPTLTIGKILKENLNCMVYIGGQIVQRLKLSKFSQQFPFVDSFEDSLDSSIQWKGVNIVPFTPEHCHLPSFRCINLGDYFNSKILLPLKVTNGCYWSKCSFCAIHYPFSYLCSLSDVTDVIQYIKYQQETQNIDMVWLVDEAIPKEWLQLFASKVCESGLKINWALNGSRFEPDLDLEFFNILKAAGCCAISFGLETYSQELLNRMNKGVFVSNIQRTIDLCNEAGISILSSVFFGFPGETLQTIKNTRDFLYINSDKFRYVMIGKFILEKLSPIGCNPPKWGISADAYSDPGPLSPYFEYNLPPAILKKSNEVIEEFRNIYSDSLAANVLYMGSEDVPSKVTGRYTTIPTKKLAETICIPEITVARIIDTMEFELNSYQWDTRLILRV